MFTRSIPSTESALETSRLFASTPHLAGTPGDFDTAKQFLAFLREELTIDSSSPELPIFPAGTPESRSATLNITSYTEPKAWIDTYFPMLNFPLSHSLEVLGPDGNPIWTAELEEVADEADPYAAEYATAVLTWHGYSKGGEAQGKLVYANYGRKQDYDELVRAGNYAPGLMSPSVRLIFSRCGLQWQDRIDSLWSCFSWIKGWSGARNILRSCTNSTFRSKQLKS